MEKTIYIYLVLFVTLMMTIGGSVGVFFAVSDIIVPAPYYESFEEYRNWQMYDVDNEERDKKLSESELRESYDAMILQSEKRDADQAKNTLIKSFGWIVVPLPVFIFFQRRLKKNKEAS